MKFQRWSILLFCLFAGGILQAQTTSWFEVRGRIIDRETKEAIPTANVRIMGTMKGVVSNAEGEYALLINKVGTVLEFSFPGYEKELRKVTEGGSQVLDVALKPKNFELPTVTITSKGMERVIEDKKLYILDYDFYEDYLFVILHRPGQKGNRIALVAPNDSIMDLEPGPEVPGKLVRDCLGNLTALTTHYACQLFVQEDGEIAYFQDTVPLFFKYVQPCIAKVDEFYYYRDYRINNQVLRYYSYNAESKAYNTFTTVENKERIYQMLDPHEDNPFSALASMSREALMHIPASVWNELTQANKDMQFWQTAFFKPIDAPLRVIGKKLYQFDHLNGRILHFDKHGTLEKEVPITYHLKHKWKKKILIDEVKERAYLQMTRNGFSYLQEINLDTGEVFGKYEIKPQFVTKVQVRNGIAYFMYKERHYDDTKRLYRQVLQ